MPWWDSTDLCGSSLKPGPLLQVTPRAHSLWSKRSYLHELHLSNVGLPRAALIFSGTGLGNLPRPQVPQSSLPCRGPRKVRAVPAPAQLLHH